VTIKGAAASPLVHSAILQLNRYLTLLQQVPVIWWRNLSMGVLMFWLCHSLAQLFWLVLPEPALPAPPVISAAQNVQQAGTASVIDVAALKSLDLFGSPADDQKAVAQVQPESVIESQAVDTSLNLLLKGIIRSLSADGGGQAIIAEGQKQALYAVGDELPVGRGVKLARILEQRVILNNNGQYESLWLYQGVDGKAKPARSNTLARATPVSLERQRRNIAKMEPKVAEQTLADIMKVSIVREAGQVVGYRIRPGKDRRMFSKLGLQTNDVVTSVNGVNLDSSNKAMEVYKTMKGKKTAQLEVKRNGEVITVDVDLGSGER